METITLTLASLAPQSVPDSGSSVLLLSAAVVGLGVIARFIKNRKS